MKDAACKDKPLSWFFPERGDFESSNKAIMVCFSCPVRAECDDYRKKTDTTDGIWAGTSTKRTPSQGE